MSRLKKIFAIFELYFFIVLINSAIFISTILFYYKFFPYHYVFSFTEKSQLIEKIGFAGAVLFGPIIEELIFRLPFVLLLKKNGKLLFLSVLFSSIFALLHPQETMIPAFIWSIFLCFLAAETKSIRVSILAHILNNLYVYYVIKYHSYHFEVIVASLVENPKLSLGVIAGFSIIIVVWIHGGRLRYIINIIDGVFLGLQKKSMQFLLQVNNKL